MYEYIIERMTAVGPELVDRCYGIFTDAEARARLEAWGTQSGQYRLRRKLRPAWEEVAWTE